MKLKRGISILILTLFLILPSLALAQNLQTPGGEGGTPAEEMCEYTDEGGKQCTSFAEGICASLGGMVVDNCPQEELENAAEGINVKLQIPLPFVKLSAGGAVDNLKDYIEGIYRLLIGLGALFAVVMIIIAGYQYLTSGGSADKTGAAKKRIMSASIGLILALLSYVILNAISVRLVEMELPKIEPIKPMFTNAEEYCQNNESIQGPLADIKAASLNYNVDKEKARCGKKYVSESGVSCFGSKCDDPEVACVKDACRSVLLYGNISWSGGFISYRYLDGIKVMPICHNMEESFTKSLFGSSRFNMLAYKSVTRRPAYAFSKADFADQLFPRNVTGTWQEALTTYILNLTGAVDTEALRKIITKDMIKTVLERQCDGRGGVKGFALGIEVNDTSSNAPTWDDDFVIGRNGSQPFYGEDAATGKRLYTGDEIKWDQVPASQLFQAGDFMAGAQCNIAVDDTTFPPQD